MPSIALYYPWMHFQDDNWLKLALLTWDRIARVRPRSLDDRDGELVRRVRGESDFIIEVVPNPAELWKVGHTFAELLETYGDQILARYAQAGDLAPPTQSFTPASNTYTPEPSLLWVYCGESSVAEGRKMDHRLRDSIVELGLARPEPSGGPWVGMHPKLGSTYLIALADAMARNALLSPATDDPRMHRSRQSRRRHLRSVR